MNLNNMNFEISRKRRQNLLIVEGNHEKEELFQLIFKVFPELNIDMESVIVHGTHIYLLYDRIVKEYGDEWYADDIDIAFVVGKKFNENNHWSIHDFTNVFLVFDYERHDVNFSVDKINQLHRYFHDAADMGKLYINYPMIESYQHFCDFPDTQFDDLKISVTLQPGAKYKEMVRGLPVTKLTGLPKKIEEILRERDLMLRIGIFV